MRDEHAKVNEKVENHRRLLQEWEALCLEVTKAIQARDQKWREISRHANTLSGNELYEAGRK